jgi:hypothetical protein
MRFVANWAAGCLSNAVRNLIQLHHIGGNTMRLLSRAAIALAAVLFVAPALHAQASFSIAAGASFPMGDAKDDLDMGYNATVGIGFKPPLAPLGLRVEGMFNSFEYKSPIDASQRVMSLTANGTFSMMPTVYLIGGVGMYNSKASTTGSEAETDVGFNVGAGVNIPLTGFGTYLEARFHHVPVEGGSMQFVPITFGIRF